MKDELKLRKIAFGCETGAPTDKKKLAALMEKIQRFAKRKMGGEGERMAKDALALEAILRRLAKFSTCEEMRNLTLGALKYRNRSFDFIRQSFRNIESATGEPLSDREKAAFQAASDWGSQLVTEMTDGLKNKVNSVVLDGIKSRLSKREVSQNLFNAMGSLNRNWRRIANTETANNVNLADCLEEVASKPKGEKAYFKRYELAGCCDECKKLDGQIALWSDEPLSDDRIKDESAKVAIWEGKNKAGRRGQMLTGTIHPNCRGGWQAWRGGEFDAILAEVGKRDEAWGKALETARKEFAGAKEPLDDRNADFMARVQELTDKFAAE